MRKHANVPHLSNVLISPAFSTSHCSPNTQAGLLLSLMGGVRKHENVPGRVAIRGDIHVLLVGDPGLGKSQLLQVS